MKVTYQPATTKVVTPPTVTLTEQTVPSNADFCIGDKRYGKPVRNPAVTVEVPAKVVLELTSLQAVFFALCMAQTEGPVLQGFDLVPGDCDAVSTDWRGKRLCSAGNVISISELRRVQY